MHRVGSLGVLLLVLAGVARADAPYTSDSLEQVRTSVQAGQAVLLDVREPAEWNRGHVADAALLPLSDIQAWRTGGGIDEAGKKRLAELIPAGRVVYTHCAKGGRAAIAGEFLRSLGYETRPLKQGYAELLEAGFTRDEEPKK